MSLLTSRTRWSARLLAALGFLQGTGILNLTDETLLAAVSGLAWLIIEFLRSAVDRAIPNPDPESSS